MHILNFNPRTREGCDNFVAQETTRKTVISIHAPVKGATASGVKALMAEPISIHAPVKGATL
jgi:hypothetical protein